MSLNSVEVSQAGFSAKDKGLDESAKEQPRTDDETLTPLQMPAIKAWLDMQYIKCKDARRPIERQWYTNLAFFNGKHYISTISSKTSSYGYKFHTPKTVPWRVRLIINKVRTVVRTEVAKLTTSRPAFSVVPRTTEDEDIAAARVAEQLFENVYYEQDFLQIMTDAIWWMSITGTSFIKTYWDQNAVYAGEKGDAKFSVVDPFHVYVSDYLQTDIDRQPFIIQTSMISKEHAKNVYGVEASKNTVSAAGDDDHLHNMWMNMSGTERVITERVLVKEFWIKPNQCPFLPQGGVVIMVGDKIVSLTQQSPYRHGKYPFTVIRHIPTGRFYGESVITDLIPLQREYNKTASQIVEAKNRMGKPKLVAPKGSIDPNKITDAPGQIITYNPGFNPPTPLPLEPLPNYVLEELDRIQRDIDDISGQHEISRGNVPKEVTAATAISFLQEQDDTRLNPTVHSIESAVGRIGTQYLNLIFQYWQSPRLIRNVGKDGAFSAQYVQANMLRGNVDVRVEAGSAMPYSKAGKQAFVMDLLKFGVIQPQEVLTILELKGVEAAQRNFLADQHQVQRENVKMANAIQVPANAWDNHQVHIGLHNNFRKSQEFESLPEQVKMIFEQHVRLHEQELMMKQMQGMGAVGAEGNEPPGNAPTPPGGTGPAPGGPPGPPG